MALLRRLPLVCRVDLGHVLLAPLAASSPGQLKNFYGEREDVRLRTANFAALKWRIGRIARASFRLVGLSEQAPSSR